VKSVARHVSGVRVQGVYVILVLLGVVGVMHGKSPASERPNVLFLAVDDLRPELGCYGVGQVKSPQIDALASRGVTFTRAYCQQAVCNPSRASLMTGLRPDSIRVWDLVTDFRTTIPHAVTLPQHFRKHGYRAVSYGKVYHNTFPDNASWDEPHRWPRKAGLWSAGARRQHAAFRRKMRAAGESEAAIRRVRPRAVESVDIADGDHVDGAIADQAIAALRELAKGEQPFFLAAGFIRPHLPFVAPRKYFRLYDRESIRLAGNQFLPRGMPAVAFGGGSLGGFYELRDYMDYRDAASPFDRPLSEQRQRELKHGYYACVSFIDAQVGRLMAELGRLGLAENTVVVLWGDHGWKLGEHGGWCKQTNYEIDTRSPLIIRAPGARAKGKQCRSLVEFVDIYPTLCDLAGLPVPGFLEGKSLARLLSDVSAKVKDEAISQFPRRHKKRRYMGYTMRTDRYRFVEWRDRKTGEPLATELYDHAKDPQENTNISDRREMQGTVRSLRKRLHQLVPPAPQEVAPPAAGRPVLKIVNERAHPVVVYWISPEGQRLSRGLLAPGRTHLSHTTVGHKFVVANTDGSGAREIVVRRDGQVETIANVSPPPAGRGPKPNIVVFMADDWSWPHAGILGDPVAKTPHFDRIAREGVLFENAYVSCPSCTPSRLSVLTGQHHWRLEEGASLGGSLREQFGVYTELLQAAGYRIGRFGKGVWPSKHLFRRRDSFGKAFRSFDEFLKQRAPGVPFCYWHGGQDPHRPYECGVGARSGTNLKDVRVPACLPDHQIVRSDLADYYWEVGRFDREIGQVMATLKAMGELENTIIVVSGDNGMPFPRCKGTLYDMGTRVPLAVRWGAKVKGNRRVSDFVSLCDLAPTFLEAAGLAPPDAMTGRSLLALLASGRAGQIEATRRFVLTGLEQHVFANPSRAIRTSEFLYIRNFDPQTWRTGAPEGKPARYDFAKDPWPRGAAAFSYNCDPSPTKQFLRLRRGEPAVKRLADLAFGPRPDEELYDLRKDPDQLHNVAADPRYAAQAQRLRNRLLAELRDADDPRIGKQADLKWRVLPPPARLKAPSFYKKHLDADGYPILASGSVNDYALKEAAFLITKMLAHRPDVRKAMVDSGSRFLILGHDEYTTTLPEFAHFRPKDYWDARARGTGGSRTDPYCTCGEENLLGYEGDPYAKENILIHEFAHSIHLRGMVRVDPTFDKRLEAAYDRAVAKGLWKGKYAGTNHHEYFAEGVQSWFNNNREDDSDHNHVNTRGELLEYDPGLAAICREVFGKTVLEYTKPVTRLHGHLAGYDPRKAPKFVWPKRLDGVRERIRRHARQRSEAVKGARPNVLFIAVDDLNDWVGCLGGHPQAQTPNIDRLAKSGVLFTNAYCPAASCNPSRTAIMTGITPARSGLYTNMQKMRHVLPNAEIIPRYFSCYGYHAAGSGKILHYFIDAHSWHDYFPDKHRENPLPRTLYPEKRPVSLPYEKWMYREADWAALDATDREYGGDWLVSNWVAKQLRRKQDKPFFLACGIYRPHEPWFVPRKYYDMVPGESDIRLPPGLRADDLDDLPPVARKIGPNRYLAHIRKHGQWKAGVRGYLAAIAFADAMVGRVIEALEAGPNRDNTIVVLWSDHGWHLGEKQHWQKFTGWRVCDRVPLIIRAPEGTPGLRGGTPAGARCSRPVSLVSLFDTLTDLCGLPIKPQASPHSLVPLLERPDAAWPHPAITHFGRPGRYAISTEQWRYIHYEDGGEELYDIQADPHEWHNLAGRPKHAARLAEMRRMAPSDPLPMAPATKRPPARAKATSKQTPHPRAQNARTRGV